MGDVMKKGLTLLVIVLAFASSIFTAYGVGYVNGSDDSFVFDATTELSDTLAQLKLVESSDVASLHQKLLVKLEVQIAKVEDTTQCRRFPLDYIRRFRFLREAGIGSGFWSEEANGSVEKAKAFKGLTHG